MWAAGFLEGEGSFGAHKGSPYISCPQVITEPLYLLKQMFGGSVTGPVISNLPNRQPRYVWRCAGPRAVGLMMTLYTLMSEKRQAQIREGLRIWKTGPSWSRKMRDTIDAKYKDLNAPKNWEVKNATVGS